MSEQILKALMQLFAIIARPESNTEDRKDVVESFLKKQLNEDLVSVYLSIFENYYNTYQDKQKHSDKQRRFISAGSVKVLKICAGINEELTQQQKIVVLVQLLEFVKSGKSNEISDQELEFIYTVADSFHITEEDYNLIKDFVLFEFGQIPASSYVLLIDNQKDFFHPKVKHRLLPTLQGQIRVLNVSTTNMYLIRYMGSNEILLNGQLIQKEKSYVFTVGGSLRNQQIKPIYYSDIVSYFNDEKYNERIVFEVRNVEYRFKNGALGLHDISFSEENLRC